MKLIPYLKEILHRATHKDMTLADVLTLAEETILIFSFVFGLFIIPPFSSVIMMMEEHDPLNRFMRVTFNMELSLSLKCLHVMLFVSYIIYQSAHVIIYPLNIGSVYVYTTGYWLKLLTSNYKRNKYKSGNIHYVWKVCKSYRRIQILNGALNSTFGNIWASFHMGSFMGIALSCSFGLIRWHDSIPLMTNFVLVVTISIAGLIVFCEFLFLYTLKDTSFEFLEATKESTTRKSFFGKLVNAFWPVELKIGGPFFTIGHIGFLIYLEKYLSFLTTLLLSIPQ